MVKKRWIKTYCGDCVIASDKPLVWDRTSTIKLEKKPKDKFCCSICGSDDIEQEMFVRINEDLPTTLSDDAEVNIGICNDCETSVSIIPMLDYRTEIIT